MVAISEIDKQDATLRSLSLNPLDNCIQSSIYSSNDLSDEFTEILEYAFALDSSHE